jgi:hypothetical protein
MQAYGIDGNGMGISLVQNSKGLLFDVYIPPDKSASATFSESLGNLTSVNLSLTDPTCTEALVQGANSFIYQTSPISSVWNRVEQYVDDSTETDSHNLLTTAQNTLFSGAMGPSLATTVTDTPYLVYGRDYMIGDKVSVEVRSGDPLNGIPGNVYTDIVSSVTLTCDATQTPILSAVPIIGNSMNSTSTNKSQYNQLVARIKEIEKKLAKKGS